MKIQRKLRALWLMVAMLSTLAGSAGASIYAFREGASNIEFGGFQNLEGTIESSELGTFTTGGAVGSFLNSASYSFVGLFHQAFGLAAPIPITMDNSNSSWTVDVTQEFGKEPSSILLLSTESSLLLDFDTPDPSGQITLFLNYNQGANRIDFGYVHNSEFSFLHQEGYPPLNALNDEARSGRLVFPAIPEPSCIGLLFVSLLLRIGIRRR